MWFSSGFQFFLRLVPRCRLELFISYVIAAISDNRIMNCLHRFTAWFLLYNVLAKTYLAFEHKRLSSSFVYILFEKTAVASTRCWSIDKCMYSQLLYWSLCVTYNCLTGGKELTDQEGIAFFLFLNFQHQVVLFLVVSRWLFDVDYLCHIYFFSTMQMLTSILGFQWWRRGWLKEVYVLLRLSTEYLHLQSSILPRSRTPSTLFKPPD